MQIPTLWSMDPANKKLRYWELDHQNMKRAHMHTVTTSSEHSTPCFWKPESICGRRVAMNTCCGATVAAKIMEKTKLVWVLWWCASDVCAILCPLFEWKMHKLWNKENCDFMANEIFHTPRLQTGQKIKLWWKWIISSKHRCNILVIKNLKEFEIYDYQYQENKICKIWFMYHWARLMPLL